MRTIHAVFSRQTTQYALAGAEDADTAEAGAGAGAGAGGRARVAAETEAPPFLP